MSLFYVYFKDTRSGESTYLIAFINREAADEWWRLISTSPSPYSGNVERISPQCYVQNGHNRLALYPDNTELPDVRLFSQKMVITALDYLVDVGYPSSRRRSPIILPLLTFTDHISGGWYFIRSKADPFSHWYLRISGTCLVCGDVNCDAIHVSSEYRTRFCVQVCNLASDSQVPGGFVMIGRDEVSITGPKGYILHINDTGDLKATKGYQSETDFLFSDLKKRFISRGEKQVNGEVWEYIESEERGAGEPWELVD